WLPMSMSFAIDGTPALFTRNSMYGPGGAVLMLEGIVTRTPPVTLVFDSGMNRWSMFVECVTVVCRMRLTLLMLDGLGVEIVICCPLRALLGAEVMVGLDPL